MRGRVEFYCTFPKSAASVIIVCLHATCVTVRPRVMKYCETPGRGNAHGIVGHREAPTGRTRGDYAAIKEGRKIHLGISASERASENELLRSARRKMSLFFAGVMNYYLVGTSDAALSRFLVVARRRASSHTNGPEIGGVQEVPGWKLKRARDAAPIDRASSDLARSKASPRCGP